MSSSNKLEFATMCDRLQMRVENGKDIWATLMHKAQKIDPAELKDRCDLEEHFEDDSAYEHFVRVDPHTSSFRVDLPDGPVYFIQTSGFEYFFTQDGVIPSYYENLHEIVHEAARNNCEGRLILPPNSALSGGSFGFESEAIAIEPDLQMIKGIDTRYRLMKDGEAIAGALVQDNKVVTTFAVMAHLNQGVEGLISRRVTAHLDEISGKPKRRPQRDQEADDFQP